MKKLGHHCTQNDDPLLALLFQSRCKGLAEFIVRHGIHGREEQCFASREEPALLIGV